MLVLGFAFRVSVQGSGLGLGPEGHVEQEQSDDLPLAGVEKTEVQPKHPFWPVRD